MKVILILFLISLFSFFSEAKKVDKNTTANADNTSKLHTNISFEDAFVNAKHHGLGEAVVTVGSDKALEALLGFKKDFKKRIKKSFYKF